MEPIRAVAFVDWQLVHSVTDNNILLINGALLQHTIVTIVTGTAFGVVDGNLNFFKYYSLTKLKNIIR
jgi:hypothetical protein